MENMPTPCPMPLLYLFKNFSLYFQAHDFTTASLHGSVLHWKREVFAGSLYTQYSEWHLARTPRVPQKCSPVSPEQIPGRLYISGRVKEGGPGGRCSEWVIPRCASVVWGFFWTKGNQDAAGSRENSAPSYLPRRVWIRGLVHTKKWLVITFLTSV